MKNKIADKQADICADIDRGESLSLMEPLLLSDSAIQRNKLMDLVVELIAKSAGFKRSLPVDIQNSLATAVRAMNCYYSNLIEGHDTHPIEIEQALQGNYSQDIKKRNLQKEAKAHIAVQEWIDQGGIQDSLFSSSTIREVHRHFYNLVPEDLLWAKDQNDKDTIANRWMPGLFPD